MCDTTSMKICFKSSNESLGMNVSSNETTSRSMIVRVNGGMSLIMNPNEVVMIRVSLSSSEYASMSVNMTTSKYE